MGVSVHDSLMKADPEARRALLAGVTEAGLDHVTLGDHVSFHGGTGFDGLVSATAVLATPDPYAQGEPAGSDLRERRELSGHDQRVAQRQLVDAEQHPEPVVGREHGGGRDQAVEAGAAVEADVVAHREVVQAHLGHVVQDGTPGSGVGVEELVVDGDAELHGGGVEGSHARILPPRATGTNGLA